MLRLSVLAFAAVLCGEIGASATTYPPVTFNELPVYLVNWGSTDDSVGYQITLTR